MPHISIASPNNPYSHSVYDSESIRVEDLIPEHLRQSSEKFIELVKEYYNYLNTEGLPSYEINRILDEHDIDHMSSKYLDGIQAEIAKSIPDSTVMDRVALYRKIVNYYTLKGSEESVTTFFRLFFDEIVKVIYPKDRLLSLSSGNWNINEDEYVNTIIASRTYGDSSLEYNFTPFNFTNDNGDVLGSAKIAEIEPVTLYDTPPDIDGLSLDLNSTKRVNNVNDSWDSLIYKDLWRGFFFNDCGYDEARKSILFGGDRGYADFGDIGLQDSVKYDSGEHTFATRIKFTNSVENTNIQPIFSLASDYNLENSIELYYNRETQKIGRSFEHNNEPYIKSKNEDVVYSLNNFVDSNSANISSFSGDQYTHLHKFFLPITDRLNGNWLRSDVIFNGSPTYVFETETELLNLSRDDLIYYPTEGTKFPDPKFRHVGQDIVGAGQTFLGWSTDVNHTGSIIAISSVEENQETGAVRTYKYNYDTNDWEQFAQTLDGNVTKARFGERIKLSKDGTRMVVGASHEANTAGDFEAGRVYVYEYDENTDQWNQLGNVIDGLARLDNWGLAVSINDAGTIIVGGAQVYDGVAGINSGLARVYEYNENTNQWDQLGSNLEGENAGDIFGRGVDLDGVGHTLIVGTLSSDIPKNLSGHVSVFKYDGNDWNQVGQSIYGEGEEDRFGLAVAISADGKTIVGASQLNSDGFRNRALDSDDPLYRRGHARVYKFNDSLQYWEQVGTDIDGPYAAGQFGVSTDISADGTRLVVGSRFYKDGSDAERDAGVVQMYEFDDRIGDWVKFDDEIVGTGEGQAGYSATISGNGNSIVIGAPFESYASVLGIPNAHMRTLMYHEKDESGNNRWAIRSHSRDVYYTDWYTDQEFETIKPDDLKLKWNIGYHYGDDSLPVLTNVKAIKSNEEYLFQLHNRGYLSIYKKHRGEHIPWQNINIASSKEYDGQRLWEIVDYDIDGDYLFLLDSTINSTSVNSAPRESRLVIFKINDINEYTFHQTLDLDLALDYRKIADFMNVKVSKSRIVVGTQCNACTSIGQIIRVYEGTDGSWSKNSYTDIDKVSIPKVKPEIELSGFKNKTPGAWRSLNSKLSFADVSYDGLAVGAYFPTSRESIETIGYDLAQAGGSKYFNIALRFKAGETSITGIKNVLKVGNLNLDIVKENNLRRFYISTGTYSESNRHLLGNRFNTPVYKSSYHSILDVFNDDRFDPINLKDTWNNLILDLEIDNSTNEILNVRYSLNGFKYSDDLGAGTLDPIAITRDSKVTISSAISVSSLSLYKTYLSYYDFESIESYLCRYDGTPSINIDPKVDNGKFEFNESGTVIAKVTPTEVFFWKKNESRWEVSSEKVSDITSHIDAVTKELVSDEFIRQNNGKSFSYTFFGDILLLVNGGLNSKFKFNSPIPDFYSYNDHHIISKLYYIKPALITTYSNWATTSVITPTVNFSQSQYDTFVKRGINFGADIVIDNINESFAISSESANGDTADLPLESLNNFYDDKKTSVKYFIYHRVGNDILSFRPNSRSINNYPESASYGYYKNRYIAPSYSAALLYPFMFYTHESNSVIGRYSYDSLSKTYIPNAGYLLHNDFVISSTYEREIYSTLDIKQSEYNIILVKGLADRYNGFISVSINGSDFEEIFCGNTIKVLTISQYSNFVLGRNALGYLNGQITHAQYYTKAVSNDTKDEIVEYFIKNVLDFYRILFREFEGSAIGVTRMDSLPLSKDKFRYENLDGHIFNSFWYFDDEATYADNAQVRLTVNYNNAVRDTQHIYWGDRRNDVLGDNASIVHRFTSDLLGEYSDRKGRLSSVNKIQDSYFWQEFSYNIKSSVRVDDWENEFLNLVHPAGLKFFASIILLVIRLNHWFGPKWVRFDEKTRKNISLITVDSKFLSPYRTTQPRNDLRWLESLVAPNEDGGYHLPVFQPGWLQGDVSVRQFIFEAGEWTRMARSVPGNAATQRYTYEYTHGDMHLDREIRILISSGGELQVNDKIYQEVEGSIPLYGSITNIAIDGEADLGTVTLFGYPTSISDTPESQRTYALAGAHSSRLDGTAFVADVNNNHLDDYITIDLEEETDIIGLSLQGGSNANTTDIDFALASNVINKGESPASNHQNIAYNRAGDYMLIASETNSNAAVYWLNGAIIQLLATISKPTEAQVGYSPFRIREFGAAVDMSGDGSVVAISAPALDYPRPTGSGSFVEDQTGGVFVYQDTPGGWVFLGDPLYGSNPLDRFGHRVSLSDDGNTIAIGSKNSDVNGENSGEIKIFNLVNNVWEQVGPSITGEAGDELGNLVLSDSGDNIIVNGTSGYAKVFRKSTRVLEEIDNPTEYYRTYSSIHGTYNKSMLDSANAWRPSKDDQREIDAGNYGQVYAQIELESIQTITNIVTQGQTFGGNWVTSYAVSYSESGAYYNFITDSETGGNKIFAANLDSVTKVINELDLYIDARYIRIHPVSYDGEYEEKSPALRFAVTVLNEYIEWNQIADTFESDDVNYTSIDINYSGNLIALGSSSSNIAEVYKLASGKWNKLGNSISPSDPTNSTFGYNVSLSDDGNTIAISSVLNNAEIFKLTGNTWVNIADNFQYGNLKLNALGDKVLYSLETQINDDDPANFFTNQEVSVYELDTQFGYVTNANIQVSNDGVNFTHINGEANIATGLTNYNTKNAVDFTAITTDGKPVTARYVRIAPINYYNIPAIRFDVLLEDRSVNFQDGDIYTLDNPPKFATISAIPIKNKLAYIPVTGQDAQEEAYRQQDRSSIDFNSEMFVRSVLLALKYVIPCFMPRGEFAKYDYEQNLKFKDPTDISSYLPLTIKEALNNEFVFANFPAIITKRNELATEVGDHVHTEDDKALLINDVIDWWNDPTNDRDISAPVEFTVVEGSYQNTNYFNSSDTVYQDIIDGDGNNVTLEGYITDVYDNNHTLWIGWKGAINTDTGDVLPSMPQPDILFRDGVLYNNNNTATISVVQ